MIGRFTKWAIEYLFLVKEVEVLDMITHLSLDLYELNIENKISILSFILLY